jgi:hypothetical protein
MLGNMQQKKQKREGVFPFPFKVSLNETFSPTYVLQSLISFQKFNFRHFSAL